MSHTLSMAFEEPSNVTHPENPPRSNLKKVKHPKKRAAAFTISQILDENDQSEAAEIYPATEHKNTLPTIRTPELESSELEPNQKTNQLPDKSPKLLEPSIPKVKTPEITVKTNVNDRNVREESKATERDEESLESPDPQQTWELLNTFLRLSQEQTSPDLTTHPDITTESAKRNIINNNNNINFLDLLEKSSTTNPNQKQTPILPTSFIPPYSIITSPTKAHPNPQIILPPTTFNHPYVGPSQNIPGINLSQILQNPSLLNSLGQNAHNSQHNQGNPNVHGTQSGVFSSQISNLSPSQSYPNNQTANANPNNYPFLTTQLDFLPGTPEYLKTLELMTSQNQDFGVMFPGHQHVAGFPHHQQFGGLGFMDPWGLNSALNNRRCRRSRTVFSDSQLKGLEKNFTNTKYLTTNQRNKLAKESGLTQMQVKTWYQNRRMKWKKQLLQDGATSIPTKPKGRPKKVLEEQEEEEHGD
ncbi:uncharacterized protein LOC142338567 [Convolutriloba macropyga]|uniref:uncharacterized protein LOC142338567 n=1 Tax=Convolutriloba macropyga TaxID=536237 RepID=UPI003F528512